ncbi:hypothetical protein scyTo_0004263 [Scyliorhinus torazame]|uniref:Ras-associating domain-containing protein n=1 Tax=Scyliorhinus torazame TaxID=75743 RepID=A0A401NNT6_SCYTO|nr:hypothetical protein [Scyliorhinus torazame]
MCPNTNSPSLLFADLSRAVTMGSPEGAEISVWVCQEEKVVRGLTRRTSCAQVVRALLKEHLANAGDARLLHAAPGDYCIVEKWRGFERCLPPLTKLLRLWLSWGPEQANVHLVLVKWAASLPVPGLRAAEARVVQSSQGQRELASPAQYIKKLPADKQRRMVRKAFKKLAKMKRLRQGREGVETLVHLIVSQDHTIRQQLQRMRELDVDIDSFESRLHWQRTQDEGENYVQETYLVERQPGGQEWESRRQALLQLEAELQGRRQSIEQLSRDIEQELGQAWGASGQEKGQGEPRGQEQAEAARVESELQRSMCSALQLRQHFLHIQEQVRQQEMLLSQGQEEWQRLAQQLGSLSLAEGAQSACPLAAGCQDPEPVRSGCGSLSPSDVNDTDSDTGISSTHSQDSEPPCVQVFPTSPNYL